MYQESTRRLPLSAIPGIFLTCMLAILAVGGSARTMAKQPGPNDRSSSDKPEVRVGVVAFQDFQRDLKRYGRLLDELARAGEPKFHFRLASGTYADVLHWLDKELIDVAVITPGVFAETLGPASIRCQYLATVGLPPATSHLAQADRKQAGYHYQSRSVCVVAAGSLLRSHADLKRASEQQRVRFVFVNPLSVAGRIAPEFALRQLGIAVERSQVEFTDSHTGSLRLIAEGTSPEAPERVAFVWDDASRELPDSETAFRRLEIPELDELWIPQAVVVARNKYPHADTVLARLIEHRDAKGEHDFARFEDWSERYRPVRRWSEALGVSATGAESQNVTFGEIGQTLLHYARSNPEPPRLALVLSGGGAKCAYQVGAVAALEEQLAQLRRSNPEAGLDIALVVGTSGGAINAVPIALKISATPEGQAEFGAVWKDLDQREIVWPSRLVRTNIGVWFALFQTAWILWIVRRVVQQPERQGWVFAWSFVGVAVVEIVVGYLRWKPWSLLGSNHLLHHAWLWGHFGMRASAWSMLGLGLLGLTAQRELVRRGKHLTAPRRLLTTAFAIGLLGLPLAQVLTVLFYEQTLSSGSGIERALAEDFPRLIEGQLARDKVQPGLDLPGTLTAAQRLESVSRQILERGLLKRDLVLTGSCLEQTTTRLPSDLYFYAAAKRSAPPPPFGSRGVSLAAHPTILLDVVMGSGSIFPMFPPRTISNFPDVSEHVELVDGGFAHNSPTEAAVLWGATHILLIEASPAVRMERRNFLENATAAFEHLYQQSQLLDARSKGQVVVFTLAPQPPHLCVLDFADNLIASAISKGYHDARGDLPSGDEKPGAARFRKELGEPVFLKMPEEVISQ